MILTGTHINYYFICKRKLWLFSNSIQMEQESENVKLGKVISETSYDREKHEIELTDELEKIGIKIDFYDKQTNTIHEIKKTNSFENSHKWQVLYYIYALKERGIKEVKGVIDYPKLKKKVNVILSTENEKELLEIINSVKNIINKDKPITVEETNVKRAVCRKCSYYELCFT